MSNMVEQTRWINFIPCYVYWIDTGLNHQGCNNLFAHAVGLHVPQNIIGKKISDFPYYTDQIQSAELIEKNNLIVLETKKSDLLFDEANLLPSHAAETFISRKVLLYDESNKVNGLLNISFNIDNYAIQEKEKMSVALQSKMVLDNLLNNIPGHVYWKNKEGIYMGCNDRQAKSLGLYHSNDVIGKTDFELPWDKQSAVKFRSNDFEVMQTGQSRTVEEPAIVHNKPATVFSIKAPLKNLSGHISGVIGISVDITQQKIVEEKLRKAIEVAEVANRAKTEFLENIRHDIRTPLTGIIGMSTLLKDQVENETLKKYIDALVSSSQELLDFLNDILESTQNTSGIIPIVSKKFILKETVESVIALNQLKAMEKNLILKLEYDDAISPHLIGDAKRIQGILLELVTNALNFTNKGQVTVNVILFQQEARNVIIKISVTDTGIGFSSEKKDKVFEKFTRLTPSYKGKYKGAGLGLSVVKQFMDELEGEIDVESEINTGSVFTCLIPLKKSLFDDNVGRFDLKKSAQQDIKKNSSRKETKSVQPHLSADAASISKSILLVEDNELAAMAAANMLVKFSCKIDTVTDGYSAISAAEAKPYDLILLDIGLPDMDGYEVAQKIRLFNQEVPILALTAHVEEKGRKNCIAAGMNAVFTKPLTEEKIAALLDIFSPKK